MQNNEVIVHWNVPKYNTFARAHVHAHEGQLFWPCRSVGDINIYLPYKFEWIWRKDKKVSFARFYVQKFKRTCTRVHAFSEKNDYRSDHLQTLDYHPGKFHVDPLSSFWEHSQTKKYRRRRIRIITRHSLRVMSRSSVSLLPVVMANKNYVTYKSRKKLKVKTTPHNGSNLNTKYFT
jgi:hypothetical protein